MFLLFRLLLMSAIYRRSIRALDSKRRKSLTFHPVNFVHGMINLDIEIKDI